MAYGVDVTDASMQPRNDSPEKYFANTETKECAFAVWERIDTYYNEMRRTGRMALYRNSYSNFYMGWLYRATMYRSGEQGELTRTFWNHERNILLHLKAQTTQNKLAYKAQVLNSNSRSAYLVEFANGLANHYSEDPKYDLDAKMKQSVEDTLVWGDSAIVGLWDRFKGEPMAQDPMTGQILKDGDMDYFNVTPMDHILNCSLQSRNLQWRIIRRWVNKYDWAARYPELASRLLEYNDSESSYATKLVSLMHHDEESVPIFYFFHEKTEAVPQGRLMILASPECIFEDGPLDLGEGQGGYDHVPVYDNVITTMQGSPYGYTPAFDLIPLQQALNELVSSVTTNNINFATQSIIAPKGANLQYQELATGMNYFEYDPKMGPQAKPEALQLLASSPETYEFIQMTMQTMNNMAGLDQLTMGVIDKNITSGQHAALVTTQSILFNSGLQKGYARQAQNVITGTLRTIKKNMIGKKVARIVGQTSEPYLKEFTTADLTDIESITVDLVNPMIQTPAGKMAMAENLLKTGLIKDAQQYIGVYTDGDLPQLYRRQETQLKLVKQENEAIMQGICPEVSITDNHVMHLLEHTQCFDSIEFRINPNSPASIAAMQHLQKHMNKLLGGVDPITGMPEGPMNPVLAGIFGEPTLPLGTPSMLQLPPMVPGMAPPPGGAPPQGGPSQPGPKQPQSPKGQPSQPSQTTPQTGVPELAVAP